MSSSRRPLIAVLTTLAFAAAMSAQAGTAFGATPGCTHRRRRRLAAVPGGLRRHTRRARRPSAVRTTAASRAARMRRALPPPGPRPASPSPTCQPRASRPRQARRFEPLPNLPVNACHDSTLPRDYGTNFPVPTDPNGFGFANQTVIGWEGNYLRAVRLPVRLVLRPRRAADSSPRAAPAYCGAMYSFGAYDLGLAAGQAPAPGSVQWTMADGYLPALTTVVHPATTWRSRSPTSPTSRPIGGSPVELVYTRVTVTNNGTPAVYRAAGRSGPNLVPLTSPPDTVAAGPDRATTTSSPRSTPSAPAAALPTGDRS